MPKPDTLLGYDELLTLDCERMLVTLLRGLGPWKDSVFLIGGLTPRYLIESKPPDVPAHAGTQDVDIVIDLKMLADTEAYHTLEENLKKMGFERAENDAGKKLSWRWKTKTEKGVTMILELIAESPELGGGRVQPLPTEKAISALNVPYSSIALALEILRKRFAGDEKIEGYKKDGPVSVAKFELGDSDDSELKEARLLRQRQVADVIEQLLQQLK